MIRSASMYKFLYLFDCQVAHAFTRFASNEGNHFYVSCIVMSKYSYLPCLCANLSFVNFDSVSHFQVKKLRFDINIKSPLVKLRHQLFRLNLLIPINTLIHSNFYVLCSKKKKKNKETLSLCKKTPFPPSKKNKNI